MTKDTIDIPGRTFKEFFRAITALASECKLHVTDEGIHVCVVDAGNSMMLDIHANVAEKLDIQARGSSKKGGSETVIGVNVAEIHRISKVIQDTDFVTMSWKRVDKDERFFRISFDVGTYIIDMMSLDVFCLRKEPKPPAVKYDASFSIEMSKLAEFIGISQNEVKFRAKSDIAMLVTDIEDDGKISTRIGSATGEAEANYSTEYLERIVKSFPKDRIKIEFTTDSVARMTLEQGQIKAVWLLAPRNVKDSNDDDDDGY